MDTFAPAVLPFGCPDRDLLANFQVGNLPEADFDAMAAHVSSCDSCASVLQELHSGSSDDSVVDQLKECLREAPLAKSPEYARMEAMAEAIGFASTASDAGAVSPIARPLPEPMFGRLVGPYELLGTIGEGGMGVVYLARQVALDRLVALKMVLAGQHARVKSLERFRVEGKAVARLNHPNVVHVYDFGEHEGLPYYSMELVDGGSLSARLADGPLALRDAAELVRKLALAVDYANGEGVIHRDLKPSNILLAADGSPKITDFGLAKLLDADDSGKDKLPLTETDMVLGTPSYMAPEQAKGRAHEVTPATDVYALGVILYEALTGSAPFRADSKAKILELVSLYPPKPPSRLRPEIPRWLEAICLKCLEKRPALRYSTAGALAEDLGRWLEGERPKSTPGLATRLIRGARRYSAALLVGSVAVTGGAATYMSRPERTLERMEAKLADGVPVRLIGATGPPTWSKLETARAKTVTSTASDGTFTVSSWSTMLLELMPETHCECYRFSAEVRHEKCETTGSFVGVYIAHSIHPYALENAHLLVPFRFDGVRSHFPPSFQPTHRASSVKSDRKRPPVPQGNWVALQPRLFVERELPPRINYVRELARGPFFDPVEQFLQWHRLEIEVRTDTITIRWDGRATQLPRSQLVRGTDRLLNDIAPQLPKGCEPRLDLRAGVGLFVEQGAASFRKVSLTPL